MRFYVIYDFDVTKNVSVVPLQPPAVRKWNNTEGDEQYEFEYLGESFRNGKHRKYCAELSKAEFRAFINKTGLTYEDTPTMGSLSEFGWMPAMSFNGSGGMAYYEQEGVIRQGAYVTPLPEPRRNYEVRFATLENASDEEKEQLETAIERRVTRYWRLLETAMKNEFE